MNLLNWFKRAQVVQGHVCDFQRTDRLLRYPGWDGAVDVFSCSCGNSVVTSMGHGVSEGQKRAPDPRGFPYDCLFNYDAVRYVQDQRAASITFEQIHSGA